LPEHNVLISFPVNQLVSVKRFIACAFVDLIIHETNATTVRSLIVNHFVGPVPTVSALSDESPPVPIETAMTIPDTMFSITRFE